VFKYDVWYCRAPFQCNDIWPELTAFHKKKLQAI